MRCSRVIASIIIVKLVVLRRRASKGAIVRHDNDLHRGIWVLLNSPPPELIQILIKFLMVFVLVRKRVPAVLKLALAIILNYILHAAPESDDHEVVPEF